MTLRFHSNVYWCIGARRVRCTSRRQFSPTEIHIPNTISWENVLKCVPFVPIGSKSSPHRNHSRMPTTLVDEKWRYISLLAIGYSNRCEYLRSFLRLWSSRLDSSFVFDCNVSFRSGLCSYFHSTKLMFRWQLSSHSFVYKQYVVYVCLESVKIRALRR